MGSTADRGAALRASVVALLVVAYGGLGVYFHLKLRVGVVYAHFAYIPIVLASMWWGRRGVVVAVAVAGVTFSFHLCGLGHGAAWSDAARVLFFVAAAVAVGELSDRVRAGHEALRLSEEKYRWVIEESFAGILAYRDEKVLFASSRFGQMLGYGPEELVGRSIWELVHEDDRPAIRRRIEIRQAGGVPARRFECRLVRKDGRLFWTDLASCETTYQGQPAVLVNAFDITDRKHAEEKQRELAELARKQEEQLVHSTRLAELGEMAAAIAHELNQPLTGIRNFARNASYMMEEHAGTEADVAENLRLICAQVDRAAKIINRMRELARKSDHERAPVDLSRIVRDSVEFMMPQLQLSGIEVAVDLARELPQVMGDRVRLEQVLLNLLTNAKQAMEETDEPRLRVATRFEPGRDCPVVVAIEDTGKGFATEEAKKLFAPFFTTKKRGHGTGLGLSISLSIVDDHHGTIEAVGRPGEGARFTVRLPACPARAAVEESQAT